MSFKTILLGAAAIAVVGSPAMARETVEQRLERMEQVIHDQQQEISDLKAQQQQQATAPAAPAAEEVAEQPASQSDVEALQNQVYEQAAANKSGWWNSTKITGRMYYDITDVDAHNTVYPASGAPVVSRNTANGINFDIKRFYLGVDHTFDDVFSANLTTDFTYDSGSSTSQLYIKKAYLQAKLNDMFTFRLGAADLPWVPFVEDLYGYRYVENVMIDRDKFGTSADWGVHMLGKFADGLISYQISAINGAGYKKAPTNPTNRSKGIDLEGRVSLNYEGFVLGVGGYTGKLGNDKAIASTLVPDPDLQTASRFDVLAAYQADQIRAGFEYFHAKNYMNVTSSVSEDKDDGYSFFASYQFDPQWGVFGRYEWVRPETTTQVLPNVFTSNTVKDNYFNVGISYSPAKIVDFSLVYKHENVGGGALSTSNGTIGTTGGAYRNGLYNEVGLFGQLRW
jgi:hypothetical protein